MKCGKPGPLLAVVYSATVKKTAAWIEAEYGWLDILINNTGITGCAGGPPSETTV
jgi:NAD(P)-dependent dehydrogenase (short-subunit alcohol dehydrogenase family)